MVDFYKGCPMVLIGADHIELVLSTEVRMGPKVSSPVAVNTLFGWTVQGKQGMQQPGKSIGSQRVLLTSSVQPKTQLHLMMEKFMAIDRLPHVNEKEATRSKNDKLAIHTLEEKSKIIQILEIQRVQTPLLWKPGHK